MPFFNITAHLEDDHNRRTRRTYETEEVDFAAVVASVAGFLADLAGATKLRVVAYTVSQKTGYSDAVTSGANVDAGATLSLRKADGELAPLHLPDPVVGIVPAGQDVVDLTDANLVAFVDNWLTGNFRISDGETATELVSGKLDK